MVDDNEKSAIDEKVSKLNDVEGVVGEVSPPIVAEDKQAALVVAKPIPNSKYLKCSAASESNRRTKTRWHRLQDHRSGWLCGRPHKGLCGNRWRVAHHGAVGCVRDTCHRLSIGLVASDCASDQHVCANGQYLRDLEPRQC